MRAFVLAAGLGVRLRPLTDRTPKCLLPVAGRPLMQYWMDLLFANGVREVLVNSHHSHEEMARFFREAATPLQVTLTYEPRLLGSAGTLRANREFVRGEKEFFVVYGDNLTDADLTDLRQAHRRFGKAATLGLFRTPNPRDCGIVRLDDDQTIVEFQEKPSKPASDLAFGGILVGSERLFDFIPPGEPCDLGSDVFGRMGGEMAGREIRGHLRDIGTPENYARAQEEAARWKVGVS